jgi:hypothetical protein
VGNRQDNRSRGNAAQLLEKYKSLARDAQLQGDRVQAEYFHQYADHYFRVLNEGRARFEEQRRQRDDYGQDEDEDQDEAVQAGGDGEDRYEERAERPDRDRGDQGDRDRGDRDRGDRVRRDYREERNGEPRHQREAARRPDRFQQRDEEEAEERISLDVLPPAIAAVDSDVPAKAPRRRTRRPSAEGGETDIAPAA